MTESEIKEITDVAQCLLEAAGLLIRRAQSSGARAAVGASLGVLVAVEVIAKDLRGVLTNERAGPLDLDKALAAVKKLLGPAARGISSP